MRLVAWNVERLAPWLADGAAGAFATHVRDRLGDPDVLCLQEVGVRPEDVADVARMRALLPGYACHAALNRDRKNVRFRSGRAYGVATYVREAIAATAAAPAWDREGRVVVVALPAMRLAIANLYAVNGTSKPYVDPDTGVPHGDRHAHKQRFQQDLFALAGELAATADVILAGDWNVSRTAADVTPRLRTEEPHAAARAQLNAALAAGGWRDSYRDLHPDARAYTWFGRTRTGALDAARVDYIVVSPGLAARVAAADILTARADRPHSDHAPLVLELTTTRP